MYQPVIPFIGSPRVISRGVASHLAQRATQCGALLAHAERSDSSIRDLVSPCFPVFSSPSLTGWEGYLGGDSKPCLLFRATDTGALLTSGDRPKRKTPTAGFQVAVMESRTPMLIRHRNPCVGVLKRLFAHHGDLIFLSGKRMVWEYF